MEKIFALIIAAVCLVMLARLMLGGARRQRLDRMVLRWVNTARHWWFVLVTHRAAKKKAAAVAKQAIDRARKGDWKGNVYTPKSFRHKDKEADK
ncbi:MAG: hypothetical protein V4532_18480 [Pseudomonadota bacterium]